MLNSSWWPLHKFEWNLDPAIPITGISRAGFAFDGCETGFVGDGACKEFHCQDYRCSDPARITSSWNPSAAAKPCRARDCDELCECVDVECDISELLDDIEMKRCELGKISTPTAPTRAHVMCMAMKAGLMLLQVLQLLFALSKRQHTRGHSCHRRPT